MGQQWFSTWSRHDHTKLTVTYWSRSENKPNERNKQKVFEEFFITCHHRYHRRWSLSGRYRSDTAVCYFAHTHTRTNTNALVDSHIKVTSKCTKVSQHRAEDAQCSKVSTQQCVDPVQTDSANASTLRDHVQYPVHSDIIKIL